MVASTLEDVERLGRCLAGSHSSSEPKSREPTPSGPRPRCHLEPGRWNRLSHMPQLGTPPPPPHCQGLSPPQRAGQGLALKDKAACLWASPPVVEEGTYDLGADGVEFQVGDAVKVLLAGLQAANGTGKRATENMGVCGRSYQEASHPPQFPTMAAQGDPQVPLLASRACAGAGQGLEANEKTTVVCPGASEGSWWERKFTQQPG